MQASHLPLLPIKAFNDYQEKDEAAWKR